MTEIATDHAGLEVIGYEECLQLAGSVPIGRVAFVHDGEPTVLPVNHAVVGSAIVFRTTVGAKFDAVQAGAPLAFEVDDYDQEARGGWSVLVRGMAHEVEESEVGELGDLDLDPWADSKDRDRWVRLVPTEVTGRRVVRA